MAKAATTKKKPATKTAAKKPTAKKTAAKKAASSAATKKTAAKKPATSKAAAAKKPAAKKPAAKKPAAKKPAAKKAAPSKPAAAKPAAKKPAAKAEKLEFAKDDFVVYPTHGVGQVTGIENHEIAGEKLKLFVISFERERMTLKVPISKVSESGLRKLSSRKVIDTALKTLKGRVRIKRTMWSRRAQEYDAKINSGDPVAIAEVVRDLHRGEDQPDQSYSERQMYQAALDRLSRELAAVDKIDPEAAVEKVEGILAS
ncbi:MAG: CarD family transcriptional regulator [Alphaproteobacteria bacterium]|nr:CarD family transcriptional regulator [Alphaproteobacteria bacterium]